MSHRFVFVFASATLAAALIGGCSTRERPGGGRDGGGLPTDGAGTDAPFVPPPPEGTCTKMDILFVVDDSGSMAEEQGNLAANFPAFIHILDGFVTETGAPLDYRVGITTTGRDTTTIITFPPAFPVPPITMTESGPNGALVEDSSCGMSRRWIERADSDVAGTFSCAAAVGTGG